jgi:serine/threonine-protein kinase
VTLVISSGPAQVAVPDVTGQGREDARSALEGAGLVVQEQESESADAEPGIVLAQDPAGGATAPRGATVTLTVAVEPSEVAVPDVTGQEVNDALDALTEAGFRPRQDTREVETPDEDGRVLEQRPDAGEQRERGSRVTVIVGDYEPPEDLDPDPDAPADPGGGAAAPPEEGATP